MNKKSNESTHGQKDMYCRTWDALQTKIMIKKMYEFCCCCRGIKCMILKYYIASSYEVNAFDLRLVDIDQHRDSFFATVVVDLLPFLPSIVLDQNAYFVYH